MADRGRERELATACNDTCGCDVPCPGGSGCRCETTVEVTHALCTCGAHFTCADCTCGAVPADAVVGGKRAACAVPAAPARCVACDGARCSLSSRMSGVGGCGAMVVWP